MKPSEMRAEIERLTKLTQRQRATINRLRDQLNSRPPSLSAASSGHHRMASLARWPDARQARRLPSSIAGAFAPRA